VRTARLPTPADPRVVVAIATYNGRHLLEVMLPSLAGQVFRDFRVVVVDDASSDGTPAWLEREWPEVEVVALERNGGVTAAFNVCLRAAHPAPMVGLFNNDMELDPGCLGSLVEALDQHPGAGSAGAKLVSFHDRRVLDGAGDLFDWGGTGWRRGHGEIDDGRYEQPCEIFGACGGAALYRAAAIEQVGDFDESFFAFVEDTDWAFRARLAGWGCRYVPGAVAYHMGSATLGQGATEFTQYHLWRNGIWLVAKDYPPAALLRHAPRLLYVQAAQLAVAARYGRLAVLRRAVRDALRASRAVRRRRRAVQATRVVGLRTLEEAVAAGQPERRSR